MAAHLVLQTEEELMHVQPMEGLTGPLVVLNRSRKQALHHMADKG